MTNLSLEALARQSSKWWNKEELSEYLKNRLYICSDGFDSKFRVSEPKRSWISSL